MTYYEQKLKQISGRIYSNQKQIDIVIGVRNYIDTNYYTDLNLDSMSNIKLISKYHLLRLFKKYYGLTPKQYLIDIRIQKSKELLKSGVSVTRTCFEVGFESLGSFSQLFKNKTAMSPSQFQKEQLSRSKLD